MRVHPLEDIRARLRTESQKEVAKLLGISQGYLSDLLSNKRAPGDKVLKALGMRVRYEYVEKRK